MYVDCTNLLLTIENPTDRYTTSSYVARREGDPRQVVSLVVGQRAERERTTGDVEASQFRFVAESVGSVQIPHSMTTLTFVSEYQGQGISGTLVQVQSKSTGIIVCTRGCC